MRPDYGQARITLGLDFRVSNGQGSKLPSSIGRSGVKRRADSAEVERTARPLAACRSTSSVNLISPLSIPARTLRALILRSIATDTFAVLRWSPLRTVVAGRSVGVRHRMHARTLLIAIFTAFVAVLALAGSPAPARADGTAAAQAQCVNADGSPILDPATGAPVPCAAADAQPPAATPDPAQTTPDPGAPATDPAPASQPPATVDTSTTPQTDAPSAGTQEPQSVEPGTSKSNPSVKHEGKPRKRHRHGQPADSGHTGPDDSKPPPPPSSLLKPGGSPGGTTDSGSGGPSTGAVGGGGTFPLVSGPVIVPHAVPNIVLDTFRVPPFLLPIYQAAGVEYGVRWEVLAAINSIETDYGRNLSVSTAGAEGWMQFMPGTWATYGVDANRDGRKDPYNPVDAIFAAARYLKAAGAGDSLQKAIFSYNHAQWYVDDVLARARALSAIPAEVIGSLSGLTLGRFPIAAPSTYAGRLDTRAKTGRVTSGNAALTVGSSAARRGMRIYTRPGAPVVAVQDATVVAIGTNRRLGRYIRLRDAYGNTYTYAHLAKVAALHPVPKPRAESEQAIRRELGLDGKDPKPTGSATAGKQTSTPQSSAQTLSATTLAAPATTGSPATSGVAAPIFTTQHPGGNVGALTGDAPTDTGATGATPAATSTDPVASAPAATVPVEKTSTAALIRGVATTPDATLTAAADSSGRPPLYLRLRAYARLAMAKLDAAAPAVDVSTFGAYFADRPAGLKRGDYVLKPMRRGAKVIAGTIIGRVGLASLRRTQGTSAGDRVAERKAAKQLHLARVPHLYFEVRPAGRKSPRIDPKPILDGWRLLDETAIYRARNPVVHSASASDKLTIGQILLMSKDQLARHVLANPNIKMYECGRQDVQAGVIDRRVLATLEFLVSRGMNPTVTALKCGHSLYTTSGNISEHSTGDAVDIAAINGTPINGHQGPGSITDKAVRQLITLQGTMKPHQIITLMQYPGTDNTLALADHYDHIHVGFHESATETSALKPSQWDRLINGLERIRNPTIIGAGQVAAAARDRASRAQRSGPTPVRVTAAVDAADIIADTPYIWGGGHSSFQAQGYDCSGSVSWVLHGAGLLDQPLTSGDLERYGDPGPGRWITIYANAAHTFMVIGGWRYDTGNLPSTGTRWSDSGRSTAGFVARHPPGL